MTIIPGEAIIIKMWESLVDTGIGGLLKPWQMRRTGRAAYQIRAEEMVAFAKAEANIKQLRHDALLIYRTEPILLNEPIVSDISGNNVQVLGLNRSAETVAETYQLADLVRKEVNVAKAVLEAENVLEHDNSHQPDAVPEKDWLYRWRDFAGEASTESMQRLWGSVLAGEIKTPGSYSLRTLDFLRCLSQSEAKLIELVAPFVIEDCIWRGSNNSMHAQHGLALKDVLILQDLGLLSGAEGMLQRTWTASSDHPTALLLKSWNKGLYLTGPLKQARVDVVKATLLGEQIFPLCHPKVNLNYLRELGEKIKSTGFDVAVVDFQIYSDKYNIFNAVQL